MSVRYPTDELLVDGDQLRFLVGINQGGVLHPLATRARVGDIFRLTNSEAEVVSDREQAPSQANISASQG